MRLNCKTKLIGEKVILIPYKKSHVEKYHTWMQNEELLELTASEPLTLQQEYEMQNSWFEDDDKCTFIILDQATLASTNNEIDAMIGDVNLYLNNDDDFKAAEIEVMIADPVHRCKGKGKEALLFMLRYGVESLALTKFVAKIKLKNEKSLNLFASIGFIQVGKSEYFQEIEMACNVSEVWKEELFDLTQNYMKTEL